MISTADGADHDQARTVLECPQEVGGRARPRDRGVRPRARLRPPDPGRPAQGPGAVRRAERGRAAGRVRWVGHERLGLDGHNRLVRGRRLHRGPGGDGRALPRGRVQRPQRARRLRHRPQRHPLQLRLLGHHRRRGAAGDQADRARRGHRRRRQGGRGVPVAVRPRRQLLPLQPGRRRRELPARGPGGRRQRHRHLPVDLPGLLLGSLAPHPLRGLRNPLRRDLVRPRSSRPPRSPCPRRPARPSTPPPATSRASPTCPRSA